MSTAILYNVLAVCIISRMSTQLSQRHLTGTTIAAVCLHDFDFKQTKQWSCFLVDFEDKQPYKLIF